MTILENLIKKGDIEIVSTVKQEGLFAVNVAGINKTGIASPISNDELYNTIDALEEYGLEDIEDGGLLGSGVSFIASLIMTGKQLDGLLKASETRE